MKDWGRRMKTIGARRFPGALTPNGFLAYSLRHFVALFLNAMIRLKMENHAASA